MELDPRNAYAALETGVGQIYALGISYALSVVGAAVLLIVGYLAAGLAERSIAAGLDRIRGFDVTLSYFFAKLARYAILALVAVMVLGQFGVQTASIIATIGALDQDDALAFFEGAARDAVTSARADRTHRWGASSPVAADPTATASAPVAPPLKSESDPSSGSAAAPPSSVGEQDLSPSADGPRDAPREEPRP